MARSIAPLAGIASIREAVGKLLAQNEQIEVAKSKYYPQSRWRWCTNNGYLNTYTVTGIVLAERLLSVSQMLYDFGKVASEFAPGNRERRQQQANIVAQYFDTVAHEAANAYCTNARAGGKWPDAAEEQLVALDSIR